MLVHIKDRSLSVPSDRSVSIYSHNYLPPFSLVHESCFSPQCPTVPMTLTPAACAPAVAECCELECNAFLLPQHDH
jgi:hypothetical protein